MGSNSTGITGERNVRLFILQLIGSEDKICEAEKQIDANGVIWERVEVI